MNWGQIGTTGGVSGGLGSGLFDRVSDALDGPRQWLVGSVLGQTDAQGNALRGRDIAANLLRPLGIGMKPAEVPQSSDMGAMLAARIAAAGGSPLGGLPAGAAAGLMGQGIDPGQNRNQRWEGNSLVQDPPKPVASPFTGQGQVPDDDSMLLKALGFGIDVATDPLTYLGVPGGFVGRQVGRGLDTALGSVRAEAIAAKQAGTLGELNQAAGGFMQSKAPRILQEGQSYKNVTPDARDALTSMGFGSPVEPKGFAFDKMPLLPESAFDIRGGRLGVRPGVDPVEESHLVRSLGLLDSLATEPGKGDALAQFRSLGGGAGSGEGIFSQAPRKPPSLGTLVPPDQADQTRKLLDAVYTAKEPGAALTPAPAGHLLDAGIPQAGDQISPLLEALQGQMSQRPVGPAGVGGTLRDPAAAMSPHIYDLLKRYPQLAARL